MTPFCSISRRLRSSIVIPRTGGYDLMVAPAEGVEACALKLAELSLSQLLEDSLYRLARYVNDLIVGAREAPAQTPGYLDANCGLPRPGESCDEDVGPQDPSPSPLS